MWGRCAYLSLGVAVGAILLAGCGDSSSAPVTGASGASGASGAGGSSALTKAAFIKQADAVCSEANTAIAALSGGATTGDEATQVSQELEIARSELQSIQALPAPSEDRSTLDDFISALKDEVTALNHKNSAVAASADTTTAEAELATARSNAEQAATLYGMKDCGTGKARPTQVGTPTVPTTATTTAVPTTTVPTTTVPVPTSTTPTVTTTPPPPPPSGGTGGSTGGGTGGGDTGSGGTGGSGGVSP